MILDELEKYINVDIIKYIIIPYLNIECTDCGTLFSTSYKFRKHQCLHGQRIFLFEEAINRIECMLSLKNVFDLYELCKITSALSYLISKFNKKDFNVRSDIHYLEKARSMSYILLVNEIDREINN
jgi:hypothetical protein